MGTSPDSILKIVEDAMVRANNAGFFAGLELARKIIERQREYMPVSEAIDDATVTYLARISDELARRETGHDKPANSF